MIFEIRTLTPATTETVISDLGDRTFISPLNWYDLGQEYTTSELMGSEDLQAAITSGDLAAKDAFGNPITDLNQLTSMQAAYNSSFTSKEIVTDSTIGSFNIKQGTGLDSHVQFAVLDSGDIKQFSVTGAGVVEGFSFNGVALATGGGGTSYLNDAGTYSIPDHKAIEEDFLPIGTGTDIKKSKWKIIEKDLVPTEEPSNIGSPGSPELRVDALYMDSTIDFLEKLVLSHEGDDKVIVNEDSTLKIYHGGTDPDSSAFSIVNSAGTLLHEMKGDGSFKNIAQIGAEQLLSMELEIGASNSLKFYVDTVLDDGKELRIGVDTDTNIIFPTFRGGAGEILAVDESGYLQWTAHCCAESVTGSGEDGTIAVWNGESSIGGIEIGEDGDILKLTDGNAVWSVPTWIEGEGTANSLAMWGDGNSIIEIEPGEDKSILRSNDGTPMWEIASYIEGEGTANNLSAWGPDNSLVEIVPGSDGDILKLTDGNASWQASTGVDGEGTENSLPVWGADNTLAEIEPGADGQLLMTSDGISSFQDPSNLANIPNASLENSSFTINETVVNLGDAIAVGNIRSAGEEVINTVPKFDGDGNIAISSITDDGETVTIGGTTVQIDANIVTSKQSSSGIVEAEVGEDAINVDWNSGNCQTIQFASGDSSPTLSFTNANAGSTLMIVFRQAGEPGGSIAGWPEFTMFPGGTAPTLSSDVSNGVDTAVIFYDGTNYFTNFAINYLIPG